MQTLQILTPNITQHDLAIMEDLLTIEELREMKQKMRDVTGVLYLQGFKERAMAEMIFKFGFLSAHIKVNKEGV